MMRSHLPTALFVTLCLIHPAGATTKPVPFAIELTANGQLEVLVRQNAMSSLRYQEKLPQSRAQPKAKRRHRDSWWQEDPEEGFSRWLWDFGLEIGFIVVLLVAVFVYSKFRSH